MNSISPTWRKNAFNKIFRRPLPKKQKAAMIQKGFKAVNPLVRQEKDRRSLTQQKRDERELDEGIVVDSEDLISDEEGEDIAMSDAQDETGLSSKEIQSKAAKTPSAKTFNDDADEYISPQEIHATLQELFDQEEEIMRLVYGHRVGKSSKPPSADMFFIKNVLIPPSKYRPEAKTTGGDITEAPENTQYKNILKQCDRLTQIKTALDGSEAMSFQRERSFKDFQNAWVALQDAVNSMIDSSRNPLKGRTGRQEIDGIKQKLEKKEGLFRMNMMGKRVNFAARSVISPDPNIETNEIGVPPVFARKLTYPEPVTNHNFYEMKEAVLNGLEKWPGAAAIENEYGNVISLRTKNYEERQALANQLLAPSNTNVNGAVNKKVHRHLTNGDIVLMNRQPTLHKPSIMAHR